MQNKLKYEFGIKDYDPFGMVMPGRNWQAGTASAYGFGFNGKLKDDDVSGYGNIYDYGFRIYNSRIGKFLSVDPLFESYPYYSSYQFAGNKPIWCIDLDGLEEQYFQEGLREDVLFDHIFENVIQQTAAHKRFIRKLESQNNFDVYYRLNNQIIGDGNTIEINSFQELIDRIGEEEALKFKPTFDAGKSLIVITVQMKGVQKSVEDGYMALIDFDLDDKTKELYNDIKYAIASFSATFIHEEEAHAIRILKKNSRHQAEEHEDYSNEYSNYTPSLSSALTKAKYAKSKMTINLKEIISHVDKILPRGDTTEKVILDKEK